MIRLRMAPLGIGVCVLSALATTGCGSTTAKARLLNVYAGQSSINMLVNNKNVASSVGYGSASGYAAVDSGSQTLLIEPTGSSSALINQTASFSTSGASTVLVTSSGVTILADNNGAPSSGHLEIRVINASYSLGIADVYVVASGTDINTVSPTVSNLAYQAASGYQSLTPGSYEVIFTPAGQKYAAIDSNPLSFSSGIIRTVVGLDGQSSGFTTAVLSDLN